MTASTAGSPQPDELETLRARVRDLEAVLHQNNLGISLAFRLTPSLANVFGLLLSQPVVTTDAIQFRLELAADPRLAIHRLRTVLKPWHEHFGLTAEDQLIQGKRNVGYWIDAPMKREIWAFIAERTQGPAEVTPEVTEEAETEAA